MIIRVWHGWTTPENASAYQELLVSRIFPGIATRQIPGYLGIRLDRRELDDEVEFVTTMGFESLEAVIAFAGVDHTHSVVPDAARAILSRYDAEATHYERLVAFDALGESVVPF